MSELRTLIKGWLDENAKEYYGISMENANAALWAFEDALDKMDEMQKALEEIEFQATITEDVEVFQAIAHQALKGNQ